MRTPTRSKAVAAIVAGLLVAGGGIAAADDISNNVDATVDAVAESMSLTAGSTNGTTQLRVLTANGDGKNGCNLTGGTSLTITLTSSNTSVATVSPSSVTFTSCSDTPTLTVTPLSEGSAAISASQSANTTGATFNLAPVAFTANVAPRPNSKPSVQVTGVTDGASYVIGSVPTAGCAVTDSEDGPSSIAAALSGSLTNGLGTQTATCDYTDKGNLKADTRTATYAIVAPPNTKPSVAVTGVTDGARYEIGSVPAAGCDVTDAEDGNSSKAAVVTGTLSHGLGSETATCDYTDKGGIAADTVSATYSVVDTGDPTITHTLSPATPNAAGWFKQDVVVDFLCDDAAGSGIRSCTGDTTLGEGANQSAIGTATDWAGNTASDTASGINVDKTAPTVGFVGGPGATYYFGSDPAAPTCGGDDGLSGLASCTVTGGGTAVGAHSYTATATDRAGNTATATLNYTVLPWTLKGFYSPVDMSGVWNTVKGGSTVPLKFEVFSGSTELTTATSVKSFTQKTVACPGASASVDEIEITSTGGTSLRYDATGGQFIQNWATPKKPGTCYTVTMTTQDGTATSANFMLK